MGAFTQIEHIGARLAAERKAAQLTVSDLSEVTHIRTDYIHAIEALRTEDLPSIGYVLGYVRSYAKAVGFNEQLAVQSFKDDISAPKDLCVSQQPHFIPKKQFKLPRGLVPAVTVMGFAVMIASWYGVQTQAEASAPETMALPAMSHVEETPKAMRADMVTIRATAPSWVQVKDAKGTSLVSRIFVTGETWQAPLGGGYSLSVRDAGAVDIYLGQDKRPPLGKTGEAKYDIVLSQH